MSGLLEVRALTVELLTLAGWVRPVNEVSLCICASESLGLVGARTPFRRPRIASRLKATVPGSSPFDFQLSTVNFLFLCATIPSLKYSAVPVRSDF